MEEQPVVYVLFGNMDKEPHMIAIFKTWSGAYEKITQLKELEPYKDDYKIEKWVVN